MNADIHYTRSGDTSIAYKVGGKGPPDMVFVPGYISHLEMSWESPQASRVWHRLTSFGRIMTFDKRGTGLSDPITDDLAGAGIRPPRSAQSPSQTIPPVL